MATNQPAPARLTRIEAHHRYMRQYFLEQARRIKGSKLKDPFYRGIRLEARMAARSCKTHFPAMWELMGERAQVKRIASRGKPALPVPEAHAQGVQDG